MTVRYSLTAATASFGKFMKLLARWKGSVWKVTWPEVATWSALTMAWCAIHIWMDGWEDTEWKEAMDAFVLEVTKLSLDELNTMLIGFTTSICLTRWVDCFRLLAWPDNLCHMFNAFVNESSLKPSEFSLLRLNVKRYILLSYVLLMRDISKAIRSKYPSYEALIDSGFATREDIAKLETSGLHPGMCHYWIPLHWILSNVKRYYKSEKMPAKKSAERSRTHSDERPSIMTEQQYLAFTGEVVRIRGMLGDLLNFDWVPLPIAIIQINIVVTYVALLHNVFCASIPITVEKDQLSMSIAVGVTAFFTLAKILLYVGWLKCMGMVLNPFGKDDDDFELGLYLGRHGQLCEAILQKPQEDTPNASKEHPMAQFLSHSVASAITAVTTLPEKHRTVQNNSLRLRQTKMPRKSSTSESV